MDRVSTIRRWIRHSGVGPVASVMSGYVAMRVLRTGIQRHLPPALVDFRRAGGSFVTSAGGFLEGLGWDAADVAIVLGEYQDVAKRLADRYSSVELRYPRTHGVEIETSAALYGLSRLLRPRTVVETGVADGRSSWVILAALERNGEGMLHSFDINAKAGGLVGQHPRWRLTILDAKEPEASFIRAVGALGTMDLFFHDSNHMYLPQLFEYRQAWPRLTPGGVLASDDVNDSRAFIDFCARHNQRATLLFDSRKITGAIRRPGGPEPRW